MAPIVPTTIKRMSVESAKANSLKNGTVSGFSFCLLFSSLSPLVLLSARFSDVLASSCFLSSSFSTPMSDQGFLLSNYAKLTNKINSKITTPKTLTPQNYKPNN
ncbi:hypothetical protein V8G54_028195 [Vigna mungo]|uniref:Uncharacterized protein n=1 Tax=Vigna mungo TaxID=3915 RepID=A0AAQ3MSX5_VIGMU